ncbi:MAG: alanine--tRNA ligase [Candidatus Marinimicrobia bacterium]|nr:alanine--tRNA ligase [Candidatus Neomarinimicrobiota bacterium]MBT6517319.1 alanine--tRNA ligase [Candidatus Neomarinimicrobiota bacterium]MBT6710437.1 alanine--tRNA ligase [Candidatus Neomarinimicrobiota bacterium]
MKSAEIRQSFIDFFKDRGHQFIRSSPVVPNDDPTLLFTNAGMNQFKPIFLNQTTPKNLRVVNSQKCIRVSGKHNDLEEVGVDTFHHTFFEMLGNWSFGDYYKKEAIQWAWELFTEVWGLDKDRLWATVYEDDDEAFDLWTEVTDIADNRVLRCGKKDNFWEMGETGPCGPCSEIHYYVGDDPENQDPKGVNNTDEYWELWNLVFIQNNRIDANTLEDLPEKHVDTGAGLERIATIIQGKKSNYDSDLFLPIIHKIESLSDFSYKENPIPFRVIADHIRMLCFAIVDGALPSNEGRGYVLRRILRRAARFGRSIDLAEPFLFKLVPTVGEVMGSIFSEVVDKRSHIEKVIRAEEVSFNQTLDRGINHFDKIISKLDGDEIGGADAFKLYDTYGFPLDLTELMARERELTVDVDGFDSEMAEQKKRAKDAGKFKGSTDSTEWIIVSEGDDSTFLGYESLESKSQIRRYTFQGDSILVVLDQTPFYAESGGQIGDMGTINGRGIELAVLDVKKENNSFIHICKGVMTEQREVNCKVDSSRRQSTMNNHTATHLMYKALKYILGDHVNQAGSLVHPDYLRFDITHFEKITADQIIEIESIVNQQILLNTKLDVTINSFDEAKAAGAEALFGEKYGDEVRVVRVGDYSLELCGGTHVKQTGDIGSFKVTEEASLSSGVRRIVAITGQKAVEEMQSNATVLLTLQQLLNTPPSGMAERISILLQEKKDLGKKLKQKKIQSSSEIDLLSDSETVGDHTIIIKKISVETIDELKGLGDQLFNKLTSGIGILFSEGDEKPFAVVVVSKDLNENGIFAGKLAKEIGGFIGGGGGGKSHLATAGGKENAAIIPALEKTKTLLIKKLKS